MTGLVCPTCRKPSKEWGMDSVSLVCTNSECARRYRRLHPEIPLVVKGDFEPVLAFDVVGDLEPFEALPDKVRALGVATQAWDVAFRGTTYVMAHYGDRTSLFSHLCDRLLPVVDIPVRRALDFGCGVGRLTIEVAHRTGANVWGLDSNPYVLRWASCAGRSVELRVPVLTSSSRFEVVTVIPPVPPQPGSVEWICADALNPPFQAESFDLVLAVNLLDSLHDPAFCLGQASALLREGGYLLLAQPDAWRSQFTAPEQWIAEDDASWEARLQQVGLRTVARVDGIEWVLHHHRRLRSSFTLHGRVAVREAWPD